MIERAQPKALRVLLQDPRLRIAGKTPPVFHLASTVLLFDKTRLVDTQEVLRLLLADKCLDPNAREPQQHLYGAEWFHTFSHLCESDTTVSMQEPLLAHRGMLEVLLQDSRVRDGINLRSDSGETAAIAAVGSRLVDVKNFESQAEADEMKRDYDRSVELLSGRGKKGLFLGDCSGRNGLW